MQVVNRVVHHMLRRGGPAALLLLACACTRELPPHGSTTAITAAATQSASKPGPGTAEPAEPRLCLAAPVASREALRCWVEWLASPALAGRAPGSPGGLAARAGIEGTFRDLSLKPAGEHDSYTQALPRGANLLALVPGSDPARAAQVIVIAAHYDHLGERDGRTYLGADDNASGVAILLELSRRLVAAPPARSVLIAAFDAEEPPAYLGEAMGSIHWMAHPTVPRPQVAAMLAMDLMGGNLWPGARTPLYVMGRETIAAAGGPPRETQGGAAPTRNMHLRLVEDLPGGRQPFSDHGAFFAAQIPVLLFSTGRSPHYHRVTDVPDTLDFEKLEGALAVVEAHLRWLADLPERPGWQTQQPVLAADAAVVADLLRTASASDGSPEFSGIAKRVVRADLARMQVLGTQTGPLTDEQARDVINVSLRAQCLLVPDDELPTAACLML